MVTHQTKSARIRAEMGYPFIDADGHFGELLPVVEGYLEDYVKRIAGADKAKAFVEATRQAHDRVVGNKWFRMSEQERRDTFSPRPAWTPPSLSTLDMATSALPKLLHSRLEEMGVDFSVQFPNYGLWVENALSKPAWVDPEWRRIIPRALNSYYAEHFRDYGDRMTPAAIIPMNTPEEAVEELEYAANDLGLKVAMLVGPLFRPVSSIHGKHPELDENVFRLESFGIDSQYDYDPVWRKCLDLKIVPTFHGWGTKFWGSRTSVSNYTSSHIGAFAVNMEAVCRSIFFGGVTHRFPDIRVAFLECGAGWACALYGDLIGHWSKRHAGTWVDMDLEEMMGLIQQHADPHIAGKLPQLREYFANRQVVGKEVASSMSGLNDGAGLPDDYALAGITKAEDIRDRFIPNFYFGCEADDPMNASAFQTAANPFGAKINVVLSSDLGHWDSPDMTKIVEEAYELVERGAITEENFKDFMFTNAVGLFAGMRPDFFKGTSVEAPVAELLAK